MMTSTAGIYYPPRSADAVTADITLIDNRLQLQDARGDVIADFSADDCAFAASVSGVNAEVNLPDGGLFQVNDAAFRWPKGIARSRWITNLESRWLSVTAAVVLTPVVLFFAYWYLIPAAAAGLVKLTPAPVVQYLDKQSLTLLEATALEPSELSPAQQNKRQQQFSGLVNAIGLDTTDYQLRFYQSDFFAANALALPGGTIIVTDRLVALLDDTPDAMAAVMLHEIGHVKQLHSLKAISRSVAATVFLTFVFQDIEAAGEVIIGSSGTLLDLAYSRKMEQQADQFALAQLNKLGLPEHALSDALQRIAPSTNQNHNEWLKYLSTHPSNAERSDH